MRAATNTGINALRRSFRWVGGVAWIASVLFSSGWAHSEPTSNKAINPTVAPVLVLDRTAVRFVAVELGGPQSPRFISARLLAFEARLEALADRDHQKSQDARPYLDRHIRAALERHIAESVLAAMPTRPAPSEAEVERQTRAARNLLLDRVGGEATLTQARQAESLGEGELLTLLRRQARASLYLDRMVTPMLQPSDAELRAVHRTVDTPFKQLPYEQATLGLRRWYIARRLAGALDAFYQGARSRIEVTVLQ